MSANADLLLRGVYSIEWKPHPLRLGQGFTDTGMALQLASIVKTFIYRTHR